ncbi:MAG TPA: aldolase/citrate lyase family protein [Microlunatus sp.]
MSLRSRAHDGEKLLGVLLRMPAEELVEMVAVSGFDFVLIDCEHGPADLIPLRQHIAAAQLHGVDVLVRIGSHEPALALRVLDQGATGIVAPHVDDADTARTLVDSVHYPPLGHRGFATYSRAGRFGLVEAVTHRDRYLSETLLLGMIESPAGVAAAGEVLAVPGIDGTMIGTADLGASRVPSDPPVADLVTEVHSVLAATSALRMDIVTGPDKAATAFAGGADLVVYNLAHTLMGHLAELRSALPTP